MIAITGSAIARLSAPSNGRSTRNPWLHVQRKPTIDKRGIYQRPLLRAPTFMQGPTAPEQTTATHLLQSPLPLLALPSPWIH